MSSEKNNNYNLTKFLQEHRITQPSKPKKKANESKDEFKLIYNDYENKIKEYEIDKKNHTHVWWGQSNGKYKIDKFEYDTLFHLYDEAITNGESCHLLERHSDLNKSCMVIDIDERYKLDVVERLHTKEHIQKIVKAYISEICQCFEIEDDDERLKAYVFEKPCINTTDKEVKDGIHIIFPHIISEYWEQLYIRKNILKKIPEIMGDLQLTCKPHQLVDEAVIHKNCWFLFGSKKKDNDNYELSYVFDYNGNYIFDSDSFDPEDNTEDMNYLIWENESPAKFLSIRLSNDKQSLITRDKILPKIIKKKKIKKSGKKKGNNINFDLDELTEIIDILSIERAGDYNNWIQIGWALYNINRNDERLLNLWIKFSEKNPEYSTKADEACRDHWNKKFTVKPGGLCIGSLYYFAKFDNEAKYNEIRRTNLRQYIDKSIESETDYDLAKVLYEMYKDQFVCASSRKSGLWYHFNGHRWEEMETHIEIYEKISTEMCEEYCRRLSDCNADSINENLTEEERDSAEKKGQKMMTIIRKLKTNSNKKSIMDECKTLFFNKEFLHKLDTNPYLIGFENGVYDLEKLQFRDGIPEDYISFSTKIDYMEFDEYDENWVDLRLFINSIFPNEDIYDYFLTFMATCLQGVNNEEKFRIWIGTGSNGKSKLEELFISAFGEYCMKFPITLLTGKRPQSNATDPAVVKAKGKRFCYFEEPNEGEKVNAGRLKEYTGGDKIEGRGMYEKSSVEYKPQFKLALLCNDLPEIPPTDAGVWRRIEVVEFKSKFVDNPIEDFEFKIDRKISEKIPNWKELFMSLLIDVYYAKYKENGIVVPDEVKKYTLNYQKQCDTYSDFIIEAIEETDGEDNKIEISDLHDEFKEWYIENFNDNKSLPSKRDFKKYLEKRYGKKKVTTKELCYCKFKSSYAKFSSGNMKLNNILGDFQ
jgi:P4 family phage/plasmid primase-like protien